MNQTSVEQSAKGQHTACSRERSISPCAHTLLPSMNTLFCLFVCHMLAYSQYVLVERARERERESEREQERERERKSESESESERERGWAGITQEHWKNT